MRESAQNDARRMRCGAIEKNLLRRVLYYRIDFRYDGVPGSMKFVFFYSNL